MIKTCIDKTLYENKIIYAHICQRQHFEFSMTKNANYRLSLRTQTLRWHKPLIYFKAVVLEQA